MSRVDGDVRDEFLFDLSADPGESNNLIRKLSDESASLKQALAEWEAGVKPK